MEVGFQIYPYDAAGSVRKEEKMKYDVILPILIAFGCSAVLCPLLIPFLKRLKFGQQVRDDGPKEHLKKKGTPTMGGLAIVAAMVMAACLYLWEYPKIVPILFTTVGFGVVGFLDDFIKVVMKRSEGLNPGQKLFGQLLVSGVFLYYLLTSPNVGTQMLIPFSGGKYLNLPLIIYIPLYFIIMLGVDNGVNFTDGLDGLCSSVTMLVAVFFTVIAIGENSGLEPVTGAMAGSLIGFLLFNVYPAQVFMGDTGSLALGGFVASTAFMLKMPLFIPIVGFIYMAEVLSVMLQVTYFKKTGGKRLFRMAPIHHHFELGGWSETRVVAVFSIVTGILCLLAFLGL